MCFFRVQISVSSTSLKWILKVHLKHGLVNLAPMRLLNELQRSQILQNLYKSTTPPSISILPSGSSNFYYALFLYKHPSPYLAMIFPGGGGGGGGGGHTVSHPGYLHSPMQMYAPENGV